MKKKIYLTLVVLLALTTVKAQITITAPSVSIANYIDTFAIPTNPADFKPLAATQANGHWDFSVAQYPGIQYFTLRTTIPTSNYPTANIKLIVKFDMTVYIN